MNSATSKGTNQTGNNGSFVCEFVKNGYHQVDHTCITLVSHLYHTCITLVSHLCYSEQKAATTGIRKAVIRYQKAANGECVTSEPAISMHVMFVGEILLNWDLKMTRQSLFKKKDEKLTHSAFLSTGCTAGHRSTTKTSEFVFILCVVCCVWCVCVCVCGVCVEKTCSLTVWVRCESTSTTGSC